MIRIKTMMNTWTSFSSLEIQSARKTTRMMTMMIEMKRMNKRMRISIFKLTIMVSIKFQIPKRTFSLAVRRSLRAASLEIRESSMLKLKMMMRRKNKRMTMNSID